jgi:peptidoglycan/LPS O-acetylase OafA/YrhL
VTGTAVPAPASRRRYDLDALRVLAFGVLILYHVGMYYVADWGWHIKSPQPSAALQYLMYLTNPWRMSLLFLVSGMAMAFACRRVSAGGLVRLRNRRLLLPLLFSMAVIVPPQLYVELITKEGLDAGYGAFMRIYLDPTTAAFPEHQHGPLGLWTWNHLWFLAYLWVYTLLFAGCKPLLDRTTAWLQPRRASAAAVVLLPVGLLTVYRLWLAADYPPTHALVGDWYNHARYVSFLFGGYLVARWDSFWEVVRAHGWRWLAMALLAYAALMLAISGGWPARAADSAAVALALRLLASADQWLWILAVLGLGARYLNRPSPLLRYMNQAILPWYMLHQTLIVLSAFWLAPLQLWQPLEALLLIGGTVAGCALGYELVKRFAVGRLLFGLKAARVELQATMAAAPPTVTVPQVPQNVR